MMPADVFAPLCPSLMSSPPQLCPCHSLPHFSAYLLLSAHRLVAQNVMASSLSGVGVRVPRLATCCAARVITPHHEIVFPSVPNETGSSVKTGDSSVCTLCVSGPDAWERAGLRSRVINGAMSRFVPLDQEEEEGWGEDGKMGRHRRPTL